MVLSRFIITVIGVDKIGIVAGITQEMAIFNVNIVDISQTIMEDMFTMIMLAAVNEHNFDLSSFQKAMAEKGNMLGVDVKVQHEDTFRFMHRI
jgi:ACT domain-containing protein